MTSRNFTIGMVVLFFLSMSFYGFWSIGYDAGLVEGRKDAMCSQARLNYNMALLLENEQMISFSKQALDECCEGGDYATKR